MDGSTDKGRIENELFVVLYCKEDGDRQEMKTFSRYLCIQEPSKADADGLVECLGKALRSLGVDDLTKEDVLSVLDSPILDCYFTLVILGLVLCPSP